MIVASRLCARRIWVLAFTVLVTAAFVAAAFLMAPVCRASVIVVDARAERGVDGGLGSALGQLGGVAVLAGISVGAAGQI